MKQRIYKALNLLLLISSAGYAEAREHNFYGALGAAKISHDAYDEGDSVVVSYTYKPSSFFVSASGFYVPELNVKSTESNARVSVRGVVAALGYEFDVKKVEFDLAVGLALNEAKASLFGRDVGVDEKMGAAFSADIFFPLNELIAIKSGLIYVNNVSNETLTIFSTGVRVSF